MKLYICPGAPNPDKLRLYLAEKQAGGAKFDLEQVFINLRKGEQRQPSHIERNPFGKLPVLELPGGQCITESLAIMEYLEELVPEPPLIGTSPLARARTRELERICDLRVLLPIAQIVHATQSPLGKTPDPGLAAHFERMLSTSLSFLDQLFSDGRPFVAGTSPSLADCTLAAGLAFGRAFSLHFLADYEHIQRWDGSYRTRTPAQSTLRH